jgi:hypothetical protein
MNHIFPVVLSAGTALSATTRDYQSRVNAAGGSVSSSQLRAIDYLYGGLLNTVGLNPSLLYGFAFLGGNLNGVVVPVFNRAGAAGNATNNGPYVPGDYSEASGLTQSSTKHLANTSVNAGNFTVSGSFFYTAYHSATLAGGQVAMGCFGVVSLEIRNASGVDARISLDAAGSNAADGAAAATASGRICGVSASATDLRVFRNGAQDGATQTNSRANPVGTAALTFGNYNGSFASMNATQCFSLAGQQSLTVTQVAQLDAIVREFLIRAGRPSCD